MSAQVVSIFYLYARRAIARFRATESRPAVDTLFGPSISGLTKIEVMSLDVVGWAEVRPKRPSKQWRVTLTPMGRKMRDEQTPERRAKR